VSCRRAVLAAWVLILMASLSACGPARQQFGKPNGADRIEGGFFHTADGVAMPLRAWLPAGRPNAVVLALHGMNDYSRSFEMPANAWRGQGIAVYAYDQRGFGGSPQRGIWPGTALMVRDLKAMATLLRARHPGVPLYLLGMSMGGAVVMAALGESEPVSADGAILVAPAVWSRDLMPPYYPPAMWIAAHMAPGVLVTSDDVRRVPTDNIAVMRELTRDPRVIKRTRADAGYGVANLMDAAVTAAPRLKLPVLLLYGERDQVIRPKPVRSAIARMPKARLRVAVYPNGWHYLLRDKQRVVVHRDVAAWIADRSAPLPSGADKRPLKLGKGE